MKKVVATLVAVLSLVGVQAQNVQAGSPTPACPQVQSNKQAGAGMMNRMPQQAQKKHKTYNPMAILKLTEEQNAKVSTNRLESSKKMVPVRAQLGIKKAELKALQVADKADMKAIYAKVDEVSKLEAEIVKIALDGKMKTRALLTDEQKLKFDMMGNHHRPSGHQPRRR